MKKDVAKLWTKALRSGKYKQGKWTLRNYDNSFCCLGVLCDIYNTEKKKSKKKTLTVTKVNDKIDGKCYKYGSYTCYLPPVVKKWAGIKTKQGQFSDVKNGEWYTLSGLNDGDFGRGSKSFDKIADIIDANIDRL